MCSEIPAPKEPELASAPQRCVFLHHLWFAAPLQTGCQPVTAPRPAAGTAAAGEEGQQGEPRGEVIEIETATKKHVGSGLWDADVTRQEVTVYRKNPKHTFRETADQWLLRHLGGDGSAVREEGLAPQLRRLAPPQAATRFSQALQGFNARWTPVAQSQQLLSCNCW